MIAPPQRGFHVIAHINLTLDVWAQTEKKRADYKSADSPHFLPSDLLGGLFWADCWTTEGGWLSSETLNGVDLRSLATADCFRQPSSLSINNKKEKALSAFFICFSCSQISPSSPRAFVTLIIHLPYSRSFGSRMESHRGTVICRPIFFHDVHWKALKNVSGIHHLPVGSFVFWLYLLVMMRPIIERHRGGFPVSTTPVRFCASPLTAQHK